MIKIGDAAPAKRYRLPIDKPKYLLPYGINALPDLPFQVLP
jgi:hypothetical protein